METTISRILELLSYNSETGRFTWIKKPCRRIRCGDVAMNKSPTGYVRIGIDGKRYLAHRLAWLYVYGEWPSGDIDHINGDTSDNRIANLRDCTRSQNLLNQGKHKNNKSGNKGVFYDSRRNKWVAKSQINRRQAYLGSFESKAAASLAYARFATEKHGQFMNLKDN